MSKAASIPVQVKLSELIVDHALSGRSEKEIRENAKSLAKEMEAHGEWDSMQPGQVFRDKEDKIHLCAGFTRVAAAESLGYKTGWFFETETDELTLRLKCITTNGGKPVSRMEQGKLYKMLENGIVADDFAGATADPKKASDWKIQPMTLAEIGEKIGKTSEHVRQCVIIHNSSPEIRELIETDQVSHNIVIKAYSWAKDDEGKALKILNAAVRAAKKAGDDKATQKHMDEIKGDFVKLKAVSEEKTNEEKKPEKTAKSLFDEDDKEDGEEKNSTERQSELPTPEDEPKPPTKKETKSIRDSAIVVILKYDEEKGLNSMTDEDASGLADALIEAGLIVEKLPF